MSYCTKQIAINVYDPITGILITTWQAFTFQGFTKEVNSGPSECVIGLPLLFDYSGIDINVGNDVEIKVTDVDTVAQAGDMGARIIYRGYISLVERNVAGHQEGVVVHILGYYTRLAMDILKNATQTTMYSKTSGYLTTTVGDISAADIGGMVRAALDRWIAESGSTRIGYGVDDIPNTGTTAEYSFEQMTYRNVLDKLLQMAPSGSFYYINELGRVKFGAKPTTPTHRFTMGKHFNSVRVQTSLEKVRNVLLVWNGELGGSQVYAHYEDSESTARYGRRVEVTSDYGISTSAAAAMIGAKFLADNKDPEVKVICDIMDNNGDQNIGYDIESIQPGDTCSFYGFDPGFDGVFRDNMLITKVQYYLDKVTLEVQIIKSGLQDFQDNQGKEIAKLQSGGLKVPAFYS